MIELTCTSSAGHDTVLSKGINYHGTNTDALSKKIISWYRYVSWCL